MYNPFTDEEKKISTTYYAELGAIGVAEMLPGRTRDVVKNWAHRNGIKVSKAYRTKVAVAANKSWVRSEETRKKIGDGHRKHNPFRCEQCGKHISHYKKLCWSCYAGLPKTGSANNNWRGGVSSVDSLARPMLWATWVYPILKRDNFTCQNCGDDKGHNLNVHHLRTYKAIKAKVLKENPHLNLRKWTDRKIVACLIVADHDFSDGITLCKTCHISAHGQNGVNCLGHPRIEDNQQPSRSNVLLFVGRKVQRVIGEDAQSDKPDTSALVPNVMGI